jgi:carbon storage regulator
MLVLSRKVGEKVVVPGCGLTLTVLAVQGNRIRLGVEAPVETAVYRAEVWQQLRDPHSSARRSPVVARR